MSHTFKRYFTDGIVDNMQLNLKDDTRETRANTKQLADKTSQIVDINSYMISSAHLLV